MIRLRVDSGYCDMRLPLRTVFAVCFMLAALCLAGPGCATRGVEERPAVDSERVVCADFETVWGQLLAAVTTGEEKLSLVDKKAGFISFQKNIPVGGLDTYAFDDTGMLMSHASANVVMHVRFESPNRTRVRINTKITASGKTVLDVFLSRERQVVLDSKGWLEREYFERVGVLSGDTPDITD